MITFDEYNRWMDLNGRLYAEQDGEAYESIKKLLPKEMAEPGAEVPDGCQAHNYPAMRMFLQQAKPQSLLEIGFNIGRSSAFWVQNGVSNLTSLEIRTSREVFLAEAMVQHEAERAGSKFMLVLTDSKDAARALNGQSFDAAFIDGDHSYEGVMADIRLCLELGIKHILFDDWLPQYGGVMLAIKHTPELRVVFVAGNMAYCVVREEGLKVAE